MCSLNSLFLFRWLREFSVAPWLGNVFRLRVGWVGVLCLPLLMVMAAPAHGKYLPVDLVLDVKSKFSDGCLSVQNLAELAQHRGIEGMVIADHDRISLEYGLPPLERIFKKKEEGPSILDSGALTYLSEIRQVDEDFPKVLLVPGVESAPYYFWTGNPFEGSLVAHNWDKHLLILGLQTAEELEQLPTLNSNFSWRYFERFKLRFIAICAVFVISVVLFSRKIFPKLMMTLAVFSLLLAANYHPLRSSLYDAYHGDAGMGPYQETINYVNERGGLVFWNHMESPTANGSRTTGGMQMDTPLHPEDLFETVNYSGFQVLDDAPVPAAAPGKSWDRLLQQYQKGERRHPVWGYGANDFHCEDQEGHKFGELRTRGPGE